LSGAIHLIIKIFVVIFSGVIKSQSNREEQKRSGNDEQNFHVLESVGYDPGRLLALHFQREPATFLFLLAYGLMDKSAELANGVCLQALHLVRLRVHDGRSVTAVRVKPEINPEKDNRFSHGS
jgi:hypothetical protein